MRRIAAVIALAAAATGIAGCSSRPESESTKNERTTQQNNYEGLVKNQPAVGMPYSPTRETINAWVKTWGKPGKVSYVYLQNTEGKMIGYFVLKGLPVSYCSALSPNYDFVNPEGDDGSQMFQVPAPGLDGTYSDAGGSCNTYYGFDASTGSYIEYTAGLGINVLLYDQPLPQSGSIQPLGPTVATK